MKRSEKIRLAYSLRKLTKRGMITCFNVLEKNNWNIDKSIECIKENKVDDRRVK